ncbi:unnamed protein product [Calypogeia fissa]
MKRLSFVNLFALVEIDYIHDSILGDKTGYDVTGLHINVGTNTFNMLIACFSDDISRKACTRITWTIPFGKCHKKLKLGMQGLFIVTSPFETSSQTCTGNRVAGDRLTFTNHSMKKMVHLRCWKY